jgi:biopolymer transport protein ExbB/TolQ
MNHNGIESQLLDIMLRAGSRWVLYLLLGLSLAAVAVMIERIWFFAQEHRPRLLIESMLGALRRDGAKSALTKLGGARSMEIAVARASLEHLDEGPGAIEDHIAAAIESERVRYERGIAFLGTLGNNAPFIGLFGTVLGIVRAFHDLAANTAAGAQAVMSGIAEALVATGVGLAVALPAVVMYNIFVRRVETSVSLATAVGHRISAYAKKEALD